MLVPDEDRAQPLSTDALGQSVVDQCREIATWRKSTRRLEYVIVYGH
jgi:hypothetical protein